MTLPILALEILMKEKGAERVSDDAKLELKRILEEELSEIVTKAGKIAQHSGRKTVNSGDLLIARE